MKKFLLFMVLLLVTSCASTATVKKKIVNNKYGGYMLVQCTIAHDCIYEVISFCDRSRIRSYSIEFD